MKILIAMDGSSSSTATIDEAASRPWPRPSEFALISALDPFFFTKAPLLLDEASKSTLQILDDAAKPLRDAGWPVSTTVLLENPRHGIPKNAADWQADLILLGSHGKSAVRRLLLGSTAQAVLRHSTCSVEIVRRPSTQANAPLQPMRILIPTDGSQDAQKAVLFVAALPWPSGTQVKIVSSPELPVLLSDFPYFEPQPLSELTDQSQQQAKESVSKAAAQIVNSPATVTTEITEPHDSPARAILAVAEAWNANLIVMGSHGRRALDRIVLGSVSETVALHANCSVQVVR